MKMKKLWSVGRPPPQAANEDVQKWNITYFARDLTDQGTMITDR